jgi:hypothetical protein
VALRNISLRVLPYSPVINISTISIFSFMFNFGKRPRGLRRGSAAAWAGIAGSNPAGVRIFLSCERYVYEQSGRDLYVGLIARPEESYSRWRVWV